MEGPGAVRTGVLAFRGVQAPKSALNKGSGPHFPLSSAASKLYKAGPSPHMGLHWLSWLQPILPQLLWAQEPRSPSEWPSRAMCDPGHRRRGNAVGSVAEAADSQRHWQEAYLGLRVLKEPGSDIHIQPHWRLEAGRGKHRNATGHRQSAEMQPLPTLPSMATRVGPERRRCPPSHSRD